MKYILASTSPYRRQLLEDFGLPFTAVPPQVDEESFKSKDLLPIELCKTLARVKAESLKKDHPDDFIMGCDQLVDLDGKVLGKGGTSEKAVAQLMELQGRKHLLITSLAVVYRDELYSHTDITTLEMRRLTQPQAEAYVNWDKTWDCAGSYKLEKAGRALFRSIRSDDSSAIVGLPLMALTDIILQVGLEPPGWSFPKK